MRQVIEKLVQLEAELKRLRDVEAENYYDLLDQARVRWGSKYNVNHEEFEAFLESRWTHRPTRDLRERVSNLEAEVHTKNNWIDYYKGKLEAVQKVLNGKGLGEAK